jgi:hypothetical protein
MPYSNRKSLINLKAGRGGEVNRSFGLAAKAGRKANR